GKHLTVRKGTFFLDKNGSLCGSQEITVRQARAFVRGINDMISADVGSIADKALGDATKKPRAPHRQGNTAGGTREVESYNFSLHLYEKILFVEKTGFYDEETMKLMQKAVKDKHQWIHFEPGRLSVTLVGSPKYFAKVKHELT